MTSFQIVISPSRRAAGRFISRVRRALQKALVEEGERHGVNQSQIADAIGVHRSVISRELNGRRDITLGRIAELAWALGREIEFNLIVAENVQGSNLPSTIAGISSQADIKIWNDDMPASVVFSVPSAIPTIIASKPILMAA